MHKLFSEIDWQCAWFASVATVAHEILAADDWRLALNSAAEQRQLQNHYGLPLKFITQEELPDGQAYEAHISVTGQVPTRDNLHDFFNALVWLTFPAIKKQLNALQAAQIAALGVGKSRGSARDAATIFDENAALLVVENSPEGVALVTALREHDWHSAFVVQASKFGKIAEVWCFGHALMEKLVHPYKAITAHTRVILVEAAYFQLAASARRAQLDQLMSAQLAEQVLSTADYTPLPVLGIPGWWPQQDPGFYADQQVFRPRRQK